MADASFKISINGDIGILEVKGSIDAGNAPSFGAKLKEIGSKTSKIVIDVKELDYIATAGLGALMANLNDAKGQGGDIIMAGMTDKIKKVFDTMGFSKVVKIVSTVADAKF